MSSRLQPALLGGLFIGVLSALPVVNCCCCLWAIAGGMLAVYLRQQETPYGLPASEGALLGLIAGFIGGIVFVIVSIPVQALTGPLQQQMVDWAMSNNGEMPPEFRDMLERSSAGGAYRAISAIFNIMLITVFSMLGGLLGVAMFKKNVPPPPPGGVEILPPA